MCRACEQTRNALSNIWRQLRNVRGHGVPRQERRSDLSAALVDTDHKAAPAVAARDEGQYRRPVGGAGRGSEPRHSGSRSEK
jgi:hypothetical protein